MKPIELKRTQIPTLGRRSFLAGSGVCMSLPLLEAMLPKGKTAFAQDATPTRMLTMFAGNGCHMETIQQDASAVFAGNFGSATSLNPLLPLIDDVTTIKGLFNDPMKGQTGDHGKGTAAFLTCAKAEKQRISTNISMDVITANQMGHETPIPLIHMGLDRVGAGFPDNGFPGAYLGNISWQNATTPVPKEIDPQALFNRLLGASLPNKAIGANINKSVIDAVLEDANRLQRRLGVADKEKIQSYLDSVHELERQLHLSGQMGQGACSTPTLGANGDFVINSRLMNDLMVMAFTCDLTRIISYMFSNGLSGRVYQNLGIRDGHHNIADHGGQLANKEKLREIEVYRIGELADLCQKLKAHTDIQGQSLLDSCIVYYSSEIADGNSHSHYNLPIVLVGKGNGVIRPGRHINVGTSPLANLYLTMMNAVGANVNAFANSSGGLDLT